MSGSDLVVYAELEPDEFMDEEGNIHKLVSSPDSPRDDDLDASLSDDEHDVQQAFSDMVYSTPADTVRDAQAKGESEPRVSVVLDCANIGYSFGEGNNNSTLSGSPKRFCVQGVELALKYFEERRVKTIAFLPSGLLRRKPTEGTGGANALMQTEELERLFTLVEKGRITVVPAGDHDDCYILSYARNKGCFIVSNDLFSDHIRGVDESVKLGMRLWISQNRCGYCFVNGHEFMISPDTALAAIVEPSMETPLNSHSMNQYSTALQPRFETPSMPPVTDGLTTLNSLIDQLVADLSQRESNGLPIDDLAISSLRHLCVARALLLMRAGNAVNRQDINFILQMEPCCCADALRTLKSHITS